MIISNHGDIPHILNQHTEFSRYICCMAPGQKSDDCVRNKILRRVLYYISEGVARLPGTTSVAAGYNVELLCHGSPG